jgi:hypothetical protein
MNYNTGVMIERSAPSRWAGVESGLLDLEAMGSAAWAIAWSGEVACRNIPLAVSRRGFLARTLAARILSRVPSV